MHLTHEEREMLEGKYGKGIQRSIELLVKLGDSFGAERLVPVSYAHISYDFCQEEFWDLMTEGVTETPHRVTTHPSYQPEIWKSWGLPLADRWIGEHERKLETFKKLGWLRTETCAEYLLGIMPRTGDVVSMGGSCMQVANNSLFGARVDRMGILISLAAAVCGRTPLMGLLLQENRYAKHIVELDNLDVTDWTASHYHCLGYYIGDQIPGFQPIAVNGLPPHLPFDFVRALVISMPTSGSVTLAHIADTQGPLRPLRNRRASSLYGRGFENLSRLPGSPSGNARHRGNRKQYHQSVRRGGSNRGNRPDSIFGPSAPLGRFESIVRAYILLTMFSSLYILVGIYKFR